MYRNTYLELYKTTANKSPSIQMLLNHFHNVYHTLGCVLQDLQFYIGQLPDRQSVTLPRDQYRQYVKKNNGRAKNKDKDKEVVKLESTLSQNCDSNVPVLNSRPLSVKGIKPASPQSVKDDVSSETSQDCNWLINRLTLGTAKAREQKKQSPPLPEVKKPPALGNDSFDSIFENRQSSNRQSSNRPSDLSKQSPMPAIPQGPESQTPPEVDNAEEDIFDRIFKEGESRRNK